MEDEGEERRSDSQVVLQHHQHLPPSIGHRDGRPLAHKAEGRSRLNHLTTQGMTRRPVGAQAMAEGGGHLDEGDRGGGIDADGEVERNRGGHEGRGERGRSGSPIHRHQRMEGAAVNCPLDHSRSTPGSETPGQPSLPPVPPLPSSASASLLSATPLFPFPQLPWAAVPHLLLRCCQAPVSHGAPLSGFSALLPLPSSVHEEGLIAPHS